jgi:hypothetical protein
MRSGAVVQAIDALLPTDAANLPQPARNSKDSWTVHWEGPKRNLEDESDETAIAALEGIARSHINRDWDLGDRVQGGSGIMYAYAIAPSGRILRLRDPLAVLWHSDDSLGNARSIPVLVMCGTDHDATPQQLEGLRELVTNDAGDVVGPSGEPFAIFTHGPDWTRTACPGDRLRDFTDRIRSGVLEEMGEDLTMDAATAIANKLEDVTDALCIYITRQQLELRADTGLPLDPSRPNPPADPAPAILEARRRARAL